MPVNESSSLSIPVHLILTPPPWALYTPGAKPGICTPCSGTGKSWGLDTLVPKNLLVGTWSFPRSGFVHLHLAPLPCLAWPSLGTRAPAAIRHAPGAHREGREAAAKPWHGPCGQHASSSICRGSRRHGQPCCVHLGSGSQPACLRLGPFPSPWGEQGRAAKTPPQHPQNPRALGGDLKQAEPCQQRQSYP